MTFGFASGLLWSAAPGVLADLFGTRADIPVTILSGIITGIITSALFGTLVTKFGRGLTTVFGLLSLPFGAFVFGFNLVLISRLIPTLTSGTRVLVNPWTEGLNYAVLSVVSVFAVVLFPRAIATTLLLRAYLIHGRRT